MDSLVYDGRLRWIDKEPTEDDERQEAAELYPQREEERLTAEREARQDRPADHRVTDSPLDDDDDDGDEDNQDEDA